MKEGPIEGWRRYKRSRYWRNQMQKRANDHRMRRPLIIEGQVVDGCDLLEWKEKLGVHPMFLVQAGKYHGERPFANAVETGNRDDPYTTYCNHCRLSWDSSYRPAQERWRFRLNLGVAQRRYVLTIGGKLFDVTLKISLDDYTAMMPPELEARIEHELALARERLIDDTFEAFDTDGHNLKEGDMLHCDACSRSAKAIKVVNGEGVEKLSWLWLREPQMAWRARLFEDVRRGRFEKRFQRRIEEMHAWP